MDPILSFLFESRESLPKFEKPRFFQTEKLGYFPIPHNQKTKSLVRLVILSNINESRVIVTSDMLDEHAGLFNDPDIDDTVNTIHFIL